MAQAKRTINYQIVGNRSQEQTFRGVTRMDSGVCYQSLVEDALLTTEPGVAAGMVSVRLWTQHSLTGIIFWSGSAQIPVYGPC